MGYDIVTPGVPSEGAYVATTSWEDVLKQAPYDLILLYDVIDHVIDVQDVLDILDSKPPSVEIILTGRYANERVIERADLVTEMKEIRHYMHKGIKARKGIEF